MTSSQAAPYKLDSSTAGKRDKTIDQTKLSVGETISSFQNKSAFPWIAQ
jgi:hypothetical protein